MDVLHHLELFVAIADRGSLASVARAHALAPSTVTAALQRLEARVGARLVVRTTRSLSLTAEGNRLLVDARRILAGVEQALEDVASEGPLRGSIRMTTINDLGRARLVEVLDAFLVEHPGVELELVLDDGVVDVVAQGFDLALRTGPLPDSGLMARLVRRSRRFVAASPGYWDRNGRPVHPDQLAEHATLVLARSGHPQRIWSFTDEDRAFSVALEPTRMANDGEVLRRWAVLGAGVVLKSDHDIEADVEAGRLEVVLEPYTRSEVNLYALHAAGRRPPRRVTALVDHLIRTLSDPR